MRNVQIGDQLSIFAWLNQMVFQVCTAPIGGIGGLVAMTWDFTAQGTRIKGEASPRNESIAPPAVPGTPPALGF